MKKFILPFICILFVSCDLTTMTNPKPINVYATKSKPSNVETNDSSFLKIKIQGSIFEVNFLKNTTVINSINGFDTFFQKNQQFINNKKVIVTGFDTANINKPFLNLISKYGIAKFITNN